MKIIDNSNGECQLVFEEEDKVPSHPTIVSVSIIKDGKDIGTKSLFITRTLGNKLLLATKPLFGGYKGICADFKSPVKMQKIG